MAWNPKTVAGKILKGAVTAGGTILGAATGLNVLGGAARVVGNVVSKGTTVLKKATGVLDNIKVRSDKVADSARNLVDGYTKEVNATNNAIKEQTRALVAESTGQTTYTNKEGIETTEKKPFNISELLKNPAVKYAALGLAALFILPKILKK